MVTHTCLNCERSFDAVSRREAERAYEGQVQRGNTTSASFEDAVDTGEVAYAKFCPYCGTAAIRVS